MPKVKDIVPLMAAHARHIVAQSIWKPKHVMQTHSSVQSTKHTRQVARH